MSFISHLKSTNRYLLESSRLVIFPLDPEELSLYLQGEDRFESSHGLASTGRTVTSDVRDRVKSSILPLMEKSSGSGFLYITFWIVVEKRSGIIVAELGFKGEPGASGSIEIGYGTMPSYRGKGYMTEAVAALVEWAARQRAARRILAETRDDNFASIRVVEKNHFRQYGKKDNMLLWERALT